MTEGGISLQLNVRAEMAPEVQVVAYAVLPSESVIAHSADFSVEKCFSHKVSIEENMRHQLRLSDVGAESVCYIMWICTHME